MKVIVGSENPVKIAATEQAFRKYFAEEPIDVSGINTDSGVSDQPLTISETLTGALNRAEAAASPDTDFSVGIEGGLSFHDVKGDEVGFEISFVCVRNNRTGRHEFSAVHGYRLYPHVLKQIRAGKNLSEAMHAEYGIEEIGKNNGVIGWLSNDVITRESSAKDGVYLALSALIKEEER